MPKNQLSNLRFHKSDIEAFANYMNQLINIVIMSSERQS